MKTYLKRIADDMIKEQLESSGAILIEGLKWCGKTTTGKFLAKSVIEMDRPDMTKQYIQMAELNPLLLLAGEVPHMIDEWQLAPNLWNAVRYEVDQRGENGQFILTGSSVPTKLDSSTHSGIGRISRIKMRTLSLYESKDSDGNVSLRDLFENKKVESISSTELQDIAYFICRGGWPRAIGETAKVALKQAVNYYNGIVADINRLSEEKRDEQRMAMLLRAYARNIAQQVSYDSLLNDIAANDIGSFSINTMYEYVKDLKRIFVIEDVPAWNPNLRSKTAIRTAQTRYFTDPSIATAALGIGPNDLINDLNTMGLLFENMCIRDLKIYAELLDGTIYHYRDKSGLECDSVIHLRNGNYGLVEIKLGGDSLIEDGVKTLKKLAKKIDTTKMKKPSFLMVLCGVAPFAYQRPDGVYVVPVTALKP